jgi:hypothetical protein
MKKLIALLIPCLLVAVFGLTAIALPGGGGGGGGGGGCCPVLTILPNTPVQGGDRIEATLTGKEDNHAVIFMGARLAPTKVYGWELDLVPMHMEYLGQFPASGEFTLQLQVPNPVPPSLQGQVLYFQGASAGPGCSGFSWGESDIDQIEFM